MVRVLPRLFPVCERYDTLLWEQSGAADTLLQNGYEWTFRTESMASLWGLHR